MAKRQQNAAAKKAAAEQTTDQGATGVDGSNAGTSATAETTPAGADAPAAGSAEGQQAEEPPAGLAGLGTEGLGSSVGVSEATTTAAEPAVQATEAEASAAETGSGDTTAEGDQTNANANATAEADADADATTEAKPQPKAGGGSCFLVEIPKCLLGRRIVRAGSQKEALEVYMAKGGVWGYSTPPIINPLEGEPEEGVEVLEADGGEE